MLGLDKLHVVELAFVGLCCAGSINPRGICVSISMTSLSRNPVCVDLHEEDEATLGSDSNLGSLAGTRGIPGGMGKTRKQATPVVGLGWPGSGTPAPGMRGDRGMRIRSPSRPFPEPRRCVVANARVGTPHYANTSSTEHQGDGPRRPKRLLASTILALPNRCFPNAMRHVDSGHHR